jgi:uncharacterized membrane protein YdjX (TVP38/TMEM64 family)
MAQGIRAGEDKRSLRRWLPLVLIAAGIVLFFLLGLQRYLSLEALRAHHAWLAESVAEHLLLVLLAYGLVYVAVVALSLPGATALTLAGGWMFGPWIATGATVVTATAGATLLFLAARTAFAQSLRRRAGPWLARLEKGFQADAFNYLLVLRLVPLVPFFVVNLVPALLGMRLKPFVLATLIGIIPGTFVFAAAGAGLGQLLESTDPLTLGSVLSPLNLTALTGLALLAVVPLLYRRWSRRRAAARHGTTMGTSR